jgi:hypothetical protein
MQEISIRSPLLARLNPPKMPWGTTDPNQQWKILGRRKARNRFKKEAAVVRPEHG